MHLTTRQKRFEYQPLIKPDSFRLISLQPAQSHKADLQCTLLHTTISECDRDIFDHYTALSYVWGVATETDIIIIDDTPKTITITLGAALRDLRDSSRIIRIWADALCIDQSNDDERANQVRLMGQIYSTAHHTVIHLGQNTPASDRVLRSLMSNTTGKHDQDMPTHQIIEKAGNSILKQAWFTRVWVFQELVLSRDPCKFCLQIDSELWIEKLNR
jgi:hypothetical protein